MSRFCIARCELYSQKRHGPLNGKCKVMESQILCIERITPDELCSFAQEILWKDIVYFIVNNVAMKDIKNVFSMSENRLSINMSNWCEFYRSTRGLVDDPHFDKLHLIELKPIVDENNEEWFSCVIKTHWLIVIQRTWKKIFKKREEIIKKRTEFNNLRYREIHGTWPPSLHHLPTLLDIKI